jgi:hypothetical protein
VDLHRFYHKLKTIETSWVATDSQVRSSVKKLSSGSGRCPENRQAYEDNLSLRKIPNELLSLCGNKVRNEILKKLKQSKYFGMSCDATPDRSKTEQTTLILRYTTLTDGKWTVEESFIEFIDFNLKKGAELADLYLSRLKHFDIPIQDMRAQGYDGGSNMVGVHKGVQAHIQRVNKFALLSPCSAHNLNLCGVHSVQSTPQSKKYFSRRFYVLFAGSPGRWAIITSLLDLTL